MLMFRIDQERLLLEYHSMKARRRGQVNWLISKDTLHIYLTHDDVTYHYLQTVKVQDDVHAGVYEILTMKFNVLKVEVDDNDGLQTQGQITGLQTQLVDNFNTTNIE